MDRDIRKRAEEKLKEEGGAEPSMSADDARALVHELRVHQIELEMQNEELRRAQTELADSRARYVDLYELAPSGYFTLDAHRVITGANLTLCGMLNMDRAELLGRRLDNLIAEEHRDTCFRLLRNAAQSGAECRFEAALVTREGKTFHGDIRCVPDEHSAEEPAGFRGSVVDITDRITAEEALIRSEERLQTVLNSADMGVWDRDFRSDCIYWSERLYALLGRNIQGTPITGETFFEYIHPADRDRVRRHLLEVLNAGKIAFYDEFRIVREDGEERWLTADGRIFYDADRHPVRMCGVNYDITERKQTEARLRVNCRQLEQFNKLAVDRELRMIELKQEVNELLEKAGAKPKYRVHFDR